MIAMIAANANAPATTSFGLCNTIRIARPGWASTLAVRVLRRRCGTSSSLAAFLGTFLHLVVVLGRGSRRWSKGRDIARWLLWLCESQRQRNGHGRTFVTPALH